jgi:predicted PurR-regulated permease PerM
VILCSGLIFGIVGMIVAVPVYTSIKVILKVFYREHSWVQKLTKDL